MASRRSPADDSRSPANRDGTDRPIHRTSWRRYRGRTRLRFDARSVGDVVVLLPDVSCSSVFVLGRSSGQRQDADDGCHRSDGLSPDAFQQRDRANALSLVALSRRLNDRPAEERQLRDILHGWTLENAAKLYETAAPASTLANRDAERWEPLLRIAMLTGDDGFVGGLLDHAARQLEVDSDDSTPEADPALLLALFQLVTHANPQP